MRQSLETARGQFWGIEDELKDRKLAASQLEMPSVRARPHADAQARAGACMQALGRAAPQPKAAHENAKRDRKERVKCYDLIVFRERKSMSDQMQPVREKIIGILHRNNVKKASFFGSIVRGEMTEESDVDLLVEFEGKKSLLDLAHLKNELEDAINRRVDVLTYKSLHPRLKDRILAEQVPII